MVYIKFEPEVYFVSDLVKYYPITHPQKAIWYTEKHYANTNICNIAATMKIKGDIDYLLYEKALNLIAEKNDAIRLRIIEEDGEPVQYVSEYKYQRVDYFDFTEKDIDEMYRFDEQLTQKPFNVIDHDLFYFALFKINDNEGAIYVKVHHIIADAWTMIEIANQIVEYYQYLKNGEKIDNRRPSYIDFVFKEEDYKKSGIMEKHKKFWNDKFETIPEITTLKPRSSNYVDPRAYRKTFIVPKHITTLIRNYCKETKNSPFTLFLSTLSIYLSRFTLEEDIVIGTPILNRASAKEKETIGMFISTVPVRLKVDNTLKFSSYLKIIKQEWKQILKNQKYPYDLLLKDFREKHKVNTNLYSITLSYQNTKFNRNKYLDEYMTRWHFHGNTSNSLDIHVSDREDEGHYVINFDYQAELFTAKEIEEIYKRLLSLIVDAVQNSSKKLSELEIMSDEEKHRILFEYNNTDTDYPRDKTIHQLFEEQVRKTPNATAIVFEDKSLTYKELNEKANQLARLLIKKGVGRDFIVGIVSERSLEMVIAMIGVLKAGGAYLPIDSDYPKERIKYIIEDSNISIILTHRVLNSKVKFNGEIINLDDEQTYIGNNVNLECVNKPKDLAYIIYTSGSTGKPKGLMIEHQGVVSLSNWFNNTYCLDKNKNVIQMTTFSFDVATEEIIVTLLNGAVVFIPTKDDIMNKHEFAKFLNKNKINIAQFVPTTLRELLGDQEKIESLNVVICGGEELNEQLKERILAKGYNLYNHYGPTEVTVDALTTKCSGKRVSLGKPIDNKRCYILDKNLNLLPLGAVGEICISGIGIARGYFNRPELTNEKFVVNPLNKEEKIFRTGDLGRWLPDGTIEYIGRMDHQVKINGRRIELYEIKLKLKEMKGIRDAVVIDKLDKRQNKCLTAYILPENEGFTIKDKEKTYRARTVGFAPHLQNEIERIHAESWPAFFAGDKVHVSYWTKIYEIFPDYQIALFDEEKNILAVVNSIPITWNGNKECLPAGWDAALLQGFEDKESNKNVDTLCILAGVVNPIYKNRGLSYQIINAAKTLASLHGYKRIIIPVRPTQKENYPETNIVEYVKLKRENGDTYDSWLRVHERLGGKIVGFALESQKIEGTISEWENWTGQTFTQTGDCLVKGAMQPVKIDLSKDLGVYFDQAVWIEHKVPKAGQNQGSLLNVAGIRKYLARELPEYMIPSHFIFIDKMPLTLNDKIDLKALPDLYDKKRIKSKYAAPRNEFEEILANIWKSTFGVERVGIDDNFFDLGGDSLAIIEILTEIFNYDLGIKVQDFYRYPTIRELSDKIKTPENLA